MLPTLKLTELNKNLTCPLCGGYLIDASTIVECLHSFCRSCIVRYLDNSYNCPVCHTEVHKTKPLVNVRPDPTLQDIVYKIVPDLYEKERESRKLFQGSLVMNDREERNQELTNVDGISNIADNSDAVYVTLDHHQRNVVKSNQRKVFPTRYLRCSKKVPVRVLKKLIKIKFEVKKSFEVEISRCDEILADNLDLKEISRIYGLHGKTGPIDLKFDIVPNSTENDSARTKSFMNMPYQELPRHEGQRDIYPLPHKVEPQLFHESNGRNFSSSASISRPPEALHSSYSAEEDSAQDSNAYRRKYYLNR